MRMKKGCLGIPIDFCFCSSINFAAIVGFSQFAFFDNEKKIYAFTGLVFVCCYSTQLIDVFFFCYGHASILCVC